MMKTSDLQMFSGLLSQLADLIERVSDDAYEAKNAEPAAIPMVAGYGFFKELDHEERATAPVQVKQVKPVPTEEPPKVHIPPYCDRCERVTIQRYNHLVALGYQVSHLIELPNELGYALPCRKCQK